MPNTIPNSILDYHVRKFISSTYANITNATQIRALNNYVKALKKIGAWASYTTNDGFLFPFVGGTATSCSYNLVDPTKHQITWFASPTFNANGVTCDSSSTMYGTQNCLDNTGGNNLHHLAAYDRTASTSGRYYMGATAGAVFTELVAGSDVGMGDNSGANFPATVKGMYLGNRSTSSNLKAIKNGIVNATNTSTHTTTSGSAFDVFALGPTHTFKSNANLALLSYGDAFSISGTDGVKEVQTIVTVSDVSGSLNNKYFLIDTPFVNYYIWFNINSAGTDPAIANRTGIQITGATNVLASTLATSINTAFNALVQMTSTVSVNTVTVTNGIIGAVTAATNGAASPAFTFAVTTTGVTPTTMTGLFSYYSMKFQYDLGRQIQL